MATGPRNTDMNVDPIALSVNVSEMAQSPLPKRATELSDLELQIAKLERERREVHLDLLEAAHVQRRLSGPRQMQRGLFEVASEVFPVRHLAGDFVSSMDIGDQTWIALGDIAGKGIAAAMWFTHLVSVIRCHAAVLHDPAEVVAAVNRGMCELRPSPPITTMFLLRLDTKSGTVDYCNAGHPAGLLQRNETSVPLKVGGPILGVLERAEFESARLEMSRGDLLMVCSDGVLECRSVCDEEFGSDRLVNAARDSAHDSAEAVLFSILAALQDFSGGTRRQDDIGILVVRNTGPSN